VRGRALSLFYLGMPIGGAAGYVVGGWAAQHLGGFRSAFFVAGAPGVLLALAILRLPEPGRGFAADPKGAPGLRAYLGLLRNRPYVLVALAQTFAVAFLAPLLHFSVRFFEAERGLGKLQATLALAACALVAGIFGAGISGVIGDRLARRRPGGHARVAAVGYGLALPFMVVGFSAPSPWMFLPALFLGAGCLFACMPAVNTEIANVVPPEQRAMGYALAAFVLHTLGDMVSPPAFGALADARGAGGAFLGFAALLVGAAVCAELAARRLRHAAARPVVGAV
jgi:MFS family permease